MVPSVQQSSSKPRLDAALERKCPQCDGVVGDHEFPLLIGGIPAVHETNRDARIYFECENRSLSVKV